MIHNKKTLLLVEDLKHHQKEFIDALQNTVDITCASTEKEAREAFTGKKDFDIIAMDGCLNGDKVDTVELVKFIRLTYTGPIVAISGSIEYNKTLLAAGCSHQALKVQAPRLIARLLAGNFEISAASTTVNPEKKLENILCLLHCALTPAGIPAAFKHLDKLDELAKNAQDEALAKMLKEARSGLEKLKKTSGGPFSDRYCAQLTIVRDALLPS